LIECEDKDIGGVTGRLLREHVSTRERLAEKDEFIARFCEDIAPGSVVIDIGCGLDPLLFPAGFYGNLSRYFAVDKDAQCVEAVRIYAKRLGIGNLSAFMWDIDEGLEALRRLTQTDRYDGALLLKVVPVAIRADTATRGDGALLPVLGKLPAARFLVTADRESMTKRENIEKRETAALRQFIRAFGFVIEAEFSCGSEVGYYLSSN
jgi:16S rRNA (guanine(1405)-N(7))-methyltransferase